MKFINWFFSVILAFFVVLFSFFAIRVYEEKFPLYYSMQGSLMEYGSGIGCYEKENCQKYSSECQEYEKEIKENGTTQKFKQECYRGQDREQQMKDCQKRFKSCSVQEEKQKPSYQRQRNISLVIVFSAAVFLILGILFKKAPMLKFGFLFSAFGLFVFGVARGSQFWRNNQIALLILLGIIIFGLIVVGYKKSQSKI